MSESRRSWLWAGVGLLSLVAVLVMLAPAGRQYALDQRLSTLRTTPDGAAALYETLRELDIPVARRMTPLAGADAIRGTLVLLAPTMPLSPNEEEALLDWVEAGGDLIVTLYLMDPLFVQLGYESESVRAEDSRMPSSPRYAGPAPHPWTADMEEVGPVQWVLRMEEEYAPATTLLFDPVTKKPVATLIEWGEGRILLLSEPALLQNGRIARADVAPLIVRAAAAMTEPGDSVWFDEFHHGHRGGSVSAAAWRFVTTQPLGRVLLQLGVVVLLALLPLALRFGEPAMLRRAARRTPLEHVAALGAVYRQADAIQTARRRLLAGFARRIRRESPRAGEEVAYLDRLAARLPVGGEAVAAVAQAWQDDDLVELSDRIDEAVRTLRR